MSGSINPYQPTQAYDVVGVFDAEFNQLFPLARPLEATVNQRAKVMKHPVESGSTITDHKVIEPNTIDFTMLLSAEFYVDTYNEIVSVYSGDSSVYIQTNVGLFSNMLLHDIPHKETPDTFDTIKIQLKFTEIIIVQPATTKAVATQNNGNKNGKQATATQGNAANEKTEKSSAAYSILFGKGNSNEGHGE